MFKSPYANKPHLLLLLVLAITLPLCLQTTIQTRAGIPPEPTLPPVNAEAETGAVLFHQGLLTAKTKGKWGYVDKTGEFVIKPQFDLAHQFANNGLALVMPEWENERHSYYGKYGYINTKGEMVIEPVFEYAEDFGKNGLAWVYGPEGSGCINEKGEYVIKPEEDWNDWNNWSNWSRGSFADNGLAYVYFFDEGVGGFINEKGELVIAPQFNSYITSFSNGLAHIEKDGKHGFINESGKFVVPPKYDYAYDFTSYGLAAVKLDNKWGFINKIGDEILEPQYEFVWSNGFNNSGIAIVCNSWTAEMRYIDKNGDTVLETEGTIFEFNNGLAYDGEGYIDINGNRIVPGDFAITISSWLQCNAETSFFDDGYAAVKVNGWWGVIDKKGNYMIEPKFEEVFPYRDMERPSQKYGDVNGDGRVNIDDILLVRDVIFGTVGDLSAQPRKNLLLGPDDAVTIDQILFIRNMIFGER